VKIGAWILWTAVAMAFGGVVLAGYFIDLPMLLELRLLFLRWAILLSAVALLLGILNLLAAHLHKVNTQEKGWPYSALLIIILLGTLVLGLVFGPDNRVVLSLFEYIQLPVEATLMALLAVSLAAAGVRMIARRRDVYSLIFIGTALLVLMGTAPWPFGGGGLSVTFGWLRNWLAQVWAAGAARGIVLGVALGAITTGLRVLLGADRPYGD
jgi:MFS family permease